MTLRLPGRALELRSPSSEQQLNGELPLDCIRCGFVAWELIQARQQLESSDVVEIPPQAELERHLPYKIPRRSNSEELMNRLREIIKTKKTQSDNRTLRFALVNGFGTMLGDNLVGLSAMKLVLEKLVSIGEFPIEVDAYLAWNAVPGTEQILDRSGLFCRIAKRSLSLLELKSYDAYWDFSSLLRMDGYDDKNFHDFYLDHLGIDPTEIEEEKKVPKVDVCQSSISETKTHLETLNLSGPTVFLQINASTDARSVPHESAWKLVQAILEKTSAHLVYCATTSFSTDAKYKNRLINLGGWTANDLDRYFAAIYLADAVISVDTLALHVAIGLNKPGIGLFALSNPGSRLVYAKNIDGFLIPGAENLPYWKKHKSDSNWHSAESLYLESWLRLDVSAVTEVLIKKLMDVDGVVKTRTNIQNNGQHATV